MPDTTEDEVVQPQTDEEDVLDPNLGDEEEESDNLDDGTGEDDNPVTADGNDEDEDPLEAYYLERKAREAADKEEELEARVNAAVEAKLRTREAEEAAETEAKALNDTFKDTVRSIVSNLREVKVYDEDGEEVTIPDDVIQKLILQPINDMNSKQKETIGQGYTGRLAQAALTQIPAEARDKFMEEAADKKIDEWLMVFAEAVAPKTKFATKQAEREALIRKTERAKGYAQGQKAAPGTPPVEGERRQNNSQTFDLTTQFGLAGALDAGQITAEEYLAARKKLERGF